MKSLADRIEQYIRVLIERSESKILEVQRTELAETFNCVPSQITYVLATRFTPEAGFIIESRRGGKGYVRIRYLDSSQDVENRKFSQEEAFAALDLWLQRGFLTQREMRLLKCVMDRRVLGEKALERDTLRARMLKAIINLLGEDM